MQPAIYLRNEVDRLAKGEHYLFAAADLRALFPKLTTRAFRALLSRAAQAGVVERVCRGIYLNPRADRPRGYELYHAAARLRAGHLLYLSLESALSDVGVISQVPVGRVTFMTSGRSNVIRCGRFGVIELVHTDQRPSDLVTDLAFDERIRAWRASVRLAMRDMRATGRSLDLIDTEVLSESL